MEYNRRMQPSEPSKEGAYELTKTEETSMEPTWVYTGPLCIYYNY